MLLRKRPREIPQTRRRLGGFDKTYDQTVRHILGTPGGQRLTPLALWYAHEIAWRPLVGAQGAVDGPDGARYVERLTARYGFDPAEVLAEGRRAREALLPPTLRPARS